MLLHAVKIIVRELNTHFENVLTDPLTTSPLAGEDQVELGNIALMEGNGGIVKPELQNKIILTVVNLREEKTLKNTPYFRVNEAQLRTEYFNPLIFLNAFLLFSATAASYDKALSEISRIVRFFQFRSVFTHDSVDLAGVTGVPVYDRLHHFKLIIELYSPSFEELNHLWGTLGGKQYPSVLYMMRLLELEHVPPVYEGGGVIQEIERDYQPLTRYGKSN